MRAVDAREPPGLPDGVVLRAECPGDREAIGRVVARAFSSSAHARLVDEIRASSHFVCALSLVAEVDHQIVGHVMISHAELHRDEARHQVANLSPLAVSPSFQRRGIGSALVREVTARADQRSEPLVLLEGDPRFYARFGFEPAARYGIEFTLPAWAPPEAGQVLRLSAYAPTIRGRVVYPPAFEAPDLGGADPPVRSS